MNLWPFIEAEKAGHHNVNRACELFEVSRSAYYDRAGHHRPSAQRRRAHREDPNIHRSKGRYGAPRIHASCAGTASGLPEAGGPADGAAGLGGRAPRRWRDTMADRPLRTVDLIRRDFAVTRRSTPAGAATSPTSGPGRAGCTWPPSSTSARAGSWAGRWPTISAPTSSPTPCARPSPRGTPPGVELPLRPWLSVHRRNSPPWPTTAAVTLSVGRTGQCWDNAVAESFFASLKGECIDQQPWPTHTMARRAVVDYIAWYNGSRLHSTLSYLTPTEYEAATDQDQNHLAEVA